MTSNTYPSINIVGAGIAGLALACHLRRRRIPFTIFDAASKPKGHNYGITISPWGYNRLLESLEPKLDIGAFRNAVAVDKLIGGQGVAAASNHDRDEIRASDSALRDVLAKGHRVKWNHKVVSAERVTEGLKLTFENGQASTANIIIDAGSERSGLMALILPKIEPQILPYAVYHGSRYISRSSFEDKYKGVFPTGTNVRYFPPAEPTSSSQTRQQWHLQLAKSYVTLDQVPSKIRDDLNTSTNTSPTDSEPIVELRYTFSRPATNPQNSHDLLFNPTRAPDEAKTTPQAFHSEISNFLSSSNPTLPLSLSTLLAPETLQHDRILNWLLRLRPQMLEQSTLETLASSGIIAIGDAVHSTPPVGSEGASYAMLDAEKVAEWIEREFSTTAASIGSKSEEGLVKERMTKFYKDMLPTWKKAVDDAKERIEEMHVPVPSGRDGSNQSRDRLSGRM